MRLLFILTLEPSFEYCSVLESLIKKALERGHKINALYLTKEAVSLASPHFALGSMEMQLQEKIYKVSVQGEIPVLVCGRAYRLKGLPHSSLSKGMILSGYGELAKCLLEADKVIEL